MMNDPLANALSQVLNSERTGKKNCIVSHSKLISQVLKVMQENNYVGEIKHNGNSIELQLLGRINKCGAIKPRSPIKLEEMETIEKRFLPAKSFGILILSTTKGIVTNNEAKKQKLGGKLLAYCY